jgi:hypothetical protein
MRILNLAFVFAVLIAPAVFAERSAGEGDIPALIKQLGDDDPKVREAASGKLHRLGPTALKALTEATNSTDPEVASRAQTLIRQIDEDLHPKPVEQTPDEIMNRLRIRRMQALQAGQLPLQQQRVQAVRVNTQRSVSIRRNADGEVVKDITVTEAGRTVRIHESSDGIAVKTTRVVAGKEESTQVEVKDKAELKKEHPDEFLLYEKYSQTAGDEGQFRMMIDRR